MKYLAEYPHLGVFILAWFLSDLLTPLVRKGAIFLGVLDRPSARKIHSVPIPSLGGLAIFLSFGISLCSTLEFDLHLTAILLAGGAVVLVGMVDDFLEVSAVVKFFVLMGATGFLVLNGIALQLFGGYFWLNVACTLFWVVYVMSALNAEDNMDGLAAGLALIASLFLFLLAWPTWQRWLSFLAVALGGSCLGFLRYNRHPARIFMGDTGSFFLGFVLASTTVLGQWSEEPVKAIIMPVLILWVPLFDLTMITVLRWRAGKIKAIHEILTLSDKDHLSHRLVALGLSQDRAVYLICLMAILGGGAALAVQWLPLWACWGTIGSCLTLAVLGTWWLDRATSHKLVSPEGSGSESGRPA